MNMSNTLVHDVIALLIREFGADTVHKEVLQQTNVMRVDYLARLAGNDACPKITRIKVTRQLMPGLGLREAKDWVEAHFAEGGRGEPL